MLPNMTNYEVLTSTPSAVEFSAVYEGQRVQGFHGEQWLVAHPIVAGSKVAVPMLVAKATVHDEWELEWQQQLPRVFLGQLYQAGFSIRELAAVFQYGKSYLHELLVEDEVQLRPTGARGRTFEEKVEHQYLHNYLSIEQLANMFHKNHKTIASILRERGVILRTSHQQAQLRRQKELA